jgi:hypothetical protein
MRSEERIAAIAGSHLSDDELMEIYVLAAENRHLSACRQCQARFDDFARTLQHVREDAIREADHVFTPERLHDQRDRILRRLERHDHPAEIVAFPMAKAPARRVSRVLGPARRWIAGAAAAGLAAGMFLGFVMDRQAHSADLQAEAPAATAAVWQVRDDQFFVEIDAALSQSRAREVRTELGAIDVMTTPVDIREASYPR